MANPYSILSFGEFYDGISHQSSLSSEAAGKLGASPHGALGYYLSTFTWGLGWVPSLAAVGGVVTIWRDDRLVGGVLVPTGVVFLAILSAETRYFGRWILPLFPIVCLLSAYFLVKLTTWAARLARPNSRWSQGVLIGAVAILALGQGMIYSVHSDLILSRPFTFALAHEWLVTHVPRGSRVVVEPEVPNSWLEYAPGSLERVAGRRYRWTKLPNLQTVGAGQSVRTINRENYERTLRPALIAYYELHRYCWVITFTSESGRALVTPAALPDAVAYYRELASQADFTYRVSPYNHRLNTEAFNFDWTFDYYPLGYERPGPEVIVYHLSRAGCGGSRVGHD